MSDFGFDAYALDSADAGSEPHPLEIARDLIASGKPRSALEVLSRHHDALADDPEYLLICSEAWWAEGDALRAQQALLGAARLAPEDPTPLLLLGELFEEQGEAAKAARVREKAQVLEANVVERASVANAAPELEEDLIAFAERQERRTQAWLTPKPIIAVVIGAGLVAGLIGGIAALTETEAGTEAEAVAVAEAATAAATATAAGTAAVAASASATASAAAAAAATAPVAAPRRVVAEGESEPATVPVPAPEPVTVPAPPPATLPQPVSEPPTKPMPVVEPRSAAKPAAPPKKSARKPKPAPSVVRATSAEPNADEVQAALSSLAAPELTSRADALYAQGHSGVAASYYRRALELDPDYAPALVGIGRGILRAEKYDEAMQNATRALQLARGVDARPGLEAEAIYQIARVHLHRGELDSARRLFRQSISLPGTPSASWFYLGEALWNDNSPAAREAYERYLELVSKGHLADRARRAIQ